MRQAAILVLALALSSCAPPGVEYELLIVDGRVYDGTEQEARLRNVAISDGRIVTLDADADSRAARVIDAGGKLVMPGFIDPHTHAPVDAADLDATAHVNFLTQGITTLVVGNDGEGVADREATLARLAASGAGANIAFFAGHGALREAVMGYADRAPTDAELAAMQALLATEMQAGALGLSTGLYYAPGSFARTDEIIALARTAAPYGGIYETHLRDESTYNVGLLAAVEEAIRIGEAAAIAVQISHIKALGRDVWGMSSDVIALIDAARARGVDVTANQYPWQASGVALASALVPRWVMAGSGEEMRQRLADPELLPRIRAEMQTNLARRGGPQALLIVDIDSVHRGRTLAQVARDMAVDPVDAAVQLVLTEAPKVASFVMNPDDIAAFRAQSWVMTGSDGGSGHPRFYASYPKAWRDFVVERDLLTAAQFVHRSTGLVADTLGLCGRGYLRAGYIADLIVVDPEQFLPHATYQAPQRLSTGIDYLVLGGVVVIDDGRHTKQRAGSILRRNRADCPHEPLADVA